jgi:hypothetical protein
MKSYGGLMILVNFLVIWWDKSPPLRYPLMKMYNYNMKIVKSEDKKMKGKTFKEIRLIKRAMSSLSHSPLIPIIVDLSLPNN